MKLNIEEIIAIEEALHRISNTPMSYDAAKEIKEAMDIFDEEMKEINLKRDELLDKYGADHPSGYKLLHPDNEETFNKEMNEFLSGNEISDKAMIPLGVISTIQICPVDLKAIEKLISK